MKHEFEIININTTTNEQDDNNNFDWGCYCGPINELDCYYR